MSHSSSTDSVMTHEQAEAIYDELMRTDTAAVAWVGQMAYRKRMTPLEVLRKHGDPREKNKEAAE